MSSWLQLSSWFGINFTTIPCRKYDVAPRQGTRQVERRIHRRLLGGDQSTLQHPEPLPGEVPDAW
jgi:hypothetical protein